MFFVLSGFLITGLLWRQLSEGRTIAFADFYARRARRLLPASTFVILVTVAVTAAVVNPLQAGAVMRDAVSAALYSANYRFAAQGTNYLSASAPPSPLQHYWSLGVEEQFYLVWPLLLLGASFVRWGHPSRREAPSRTAAYVTLVGATAASFALSLWLTNTSRPWAFFSLPSRAWELAAGGLVALALGPLRRMPAAVAAIVGWAGIAAVLWAILDFTSSTAFPGTAALAPVLGTVAVIAAGCVPGAAGPVILLERRVFQVLGRLSYTWYLWHWPALILAPYVVGHKLGSVAVLAVVGVSLVLAAVTSAVVERPLRFSPLLARNPRRSLVVGANLTFLAAATAVLVGANLPAVAGHGTAPVARLAPKPVVVPAPRRAAGIATPQTTDPLAAARAASQAADAAVAAVVAASATVQDVPANLDPPLSKAHASLSTPLADGCFDDFADAAVHPCIYGGRGLGQDGGDIRRLPCRHVVSGVRCPGEAERLASGGPGQGDLSPH